MIRILIAEDQSLLRGALVTLLSLEPDIEVVGEAHDGEQALQMAQELLPDVLVTDIEMPGLSGIELAEKIYQTLPRIKLLIVTTFSRPGYLQRARNAGVTGYILKDAPSNELADAIRKVAAGGVAIASDLAESAWSKPDPLTARERQILRLVEAGNTNKQISLALNLSVGTVRNYLADAAQKMGASNRIEAFQMAREKGWL